MLKNKLNNVKTTIAESPLGQCLKAAQELFRETLFRYQLKAVALARESSLTEGQISSFRNGKTSLNCESWIRLVRSMPDGAKLHYLNNLFFEDNPTMLRRSFADFLREWQARESVGLAEFELALQQRTPITPARLREILDGDLPDDNELGLIGTIVRKPDKSIYTFEELQQIREYSRCNDNHLHS